MQQPNEEKGKIFVGGLSWDTTQASLLAYFSRFGEVTECVVVMNPTTGKSRGFGFVTFADPACVETVQAAAPHILDGKQIDPNGCNRKKLAKGPRGAENSKKKLFVGGLPANIDETQLREGFSKYGKVVDVVIVFDQQKQRPRGFGFLTFESEESVDKIVRERFVQISGKQVECKRAEPRDMQMMGEAPGGGGPPGQHAMMMVAGPDGTVALVPAPGGGQALMYPHGMAQAHHRGINPAELAAAYRGGMVSAHELGQQMSGVSPHGLRFMAPGLQMQNSAYMLMGAGGAGGQGMGGGYLVQGPGGQTMLVPAGMSLPGMSVPGMSVAGMSVPNMSVPGMSVAGMSVPGMSVPGMSVAGMSVPGMAQHGMQLAGSSGGGGFIVQGPGGQSYFMPSPQGGGWMLGGGGVPTSSALQSGEGLGGGQLMMAYPGLASQQQQPGAVDYASMYGLGGASSPYALSLPSSLYGYAKSESNGALAAAEQAAMPEKAVGPSFINPFALGSYPGLSFGSGYGAQLMTAAGLQADPTQAAVLAAAAASQSAGVGRIASSHGALAQSYHPYRR